MVMDFEEDCDSYGDSIEDEDDGDYYPEEGDEEEEEEEEGEEAENQDEEDSEEDEEDSEEDDDDGDEEEEGEENEGELAPHAEIDEDDSEEDDDGGDEEEGEFAPHAEMDEEGRPASSDSEEEGGLHLGSWISGVGGLAPPAAVVVRDDHRRDLVGVETPAGQGKECEESSGSVNESIASCCPICYDPWTSGGDHRVCCIPCGHIYGRSCLEKWLQQCQREARECPQCKEKFEPQQIVNLYAPPVVLQNDDLEKLIPRAKELVAMEERLQRMNEVVKETHQETEKFQHMHVATKETHQETHDMIRTPAGEL